jgi:nitrite reductase/ring-hydroxylating ferredoxin subunit
MREFVTVAALTDVPPGTGKTVDVSGIWIALCNIDGTLYAVDNTCPHAGGPLGEGKLKEGIIECPWHGWKFDLRTGQRVNNPNFTVACCDVRVVDGQIQIKLPEDICAL